jgi:hypothetical protein
MVEVRCVEVWMQLKGVLLESLIRGKYVEPQGNIQGKTG